MSNPEALQTLEQFLNDENEFNHLCEVVLQTLDTDNLGFVNKNEYKKFVEQAYSQMNLEMPSEEQIRSQFNNLDLDNDGKVTRSDLALYLRSLFKKQYETLQQQGVA